MNEPMAILRVGLTGGIACGKSTVGAMLTDLGAYVVDADRLAHRLMEPGRPAHEAIVERFGGDILDAEGRIDRVSLGARIFGNLTDREALEAILHPRVREEADRLFLARAMAGDATIGVFEAALLVETGTWQQFDRLVVVACGLETQRERLLSRPGLTELEAEKRLAAQMPVEPKVDVADYVIDTDGSLEATREATTRVYASLQADFSRICAGGA